MAQCRNFFVRSRHQQLIEKDVLTAFKVASAPFCFQHIYLSIYSILHSADVRQLKWSSVFYLLMVHLSSPLVIFFCCVLKRSSLLSWPVPPSVCTGGLESLKSVPVIVSHLISHSELPNSVVHITTNKNHTIYINLVAKFT